MAQDYLFPPTAISDLPQAATVNTTDQLEVNQAGTSRSITVSQIAGTIPLPSLSNYLPLTGGTLTGPLTGTTATMSGAITSTGGNIVVDRTGDATIASLVLIADAGQADDITLQTGNASRWIIRKSGVAESGSNAGSDLQIIARTDAGSPLATSVNINRATSAVTLSGTLTGTTATFSTAVATPIVTSTGTLVLNAATGSQVNLRINNATVVGMNATNFYPAVTDSVALGSAALRWANVYGVLGDFTGALTGTTATFTGTVTALSGTAVGAGANTQAFVKASSTANLGIYYGTGVPSFTAAKGSMYSNTTATTTTTRLYVNTDGATTWASLTTSA